MQRIFKEKPQSMDGDKIYKKRKEKQTKKNLRKSK